MRSKAVKTKAELLFIFAIIAVTVIATVISNIMPAYTDEPVNAAESDNAEQDETDDIDIYMGVGQVFSYPVSDNGRMRFKSYDKDIVTVDKNGEITALAMGTVTVKAGRDKINIGVIDAPESITLSETAFSMGVGEEYTLTASVPDSRFNAGFTYDVTSGNSVTVDQNGKITAVAVGESEITVSTYNGCAELCSITVGEAPSSVSFAAKSKNIFLGTESKLSVKLPGGCASKNTQFKSDNEEVCTVNNSGLVKTVAEGTANITVTTFNGKSAICEITVTEKPYYIRTDLDPKKPMVAFTFDDGPNAETTNRILDTLEANNCSATFFIVGNRSKGSPNSECVNKMVQNGFQLGNHTYDHKHYGDTVTATDIKKCSDTLHDITGQYPSAFRPTGGYLSNTIKKSSGGPIILWNEDTLDWKSRDADKIYKKLINNASDGDIILMHDIYDSTAEAIEKAVPELVNKGFQIVNVGELAYYKNKTLESGKIYYSIN